jgi:outer membrane protein OmpA-like peptidoglycan-associated protein
MVTGIVCCLFSFNTYAQSLIRLKGEGTDFIEHQQYAKALALLKQYWAEKQGEWEIARDIGLCHYHLGHSAEALQYLEVLLSNKEMSEDPMSIYYLALTYHGLHRFSDAANFYKLFLKTVKKDHPRYRFVIDQIKRCGTALGSGYPQHPAIVDNLGDIVNSEGDDLSPILSPNHQERLYFSSSRQGNVGALRDINGLKDDKYGSYCSDMFVTKLEKGEWTPPLAFNNLLNSPRHDVLLDINGNGQVLFYFKGFTLFSGQMLTDTFKRVEERSLFSARFDGPVMMEEGDRTPFFFNDTLLIFSSMRAGGFGGFDLYASYFSYGYWSNPVNLGPVINSSYDEVSPFLSKDGNTMYFSSNNTGSIGGFDIFFSKFNDVSLTWSDPLTMGMPINSAHDDLYFRLSKDGSLAYYSSNRMNGFGQHDIYEAIFPTARTEQLTESDAITFVDKIRRAEENTLLTEMKTPLQDTVITVVVPLEKPDISSLTYTDDNDLLGVLNIQYVNQWINLLKKYPEVKLILNGHSEESEKPHIDLYFTIKRVEKVAAYMTANGIDPDRLMLRSHGGNFPVSKTVLENVPYPAGNRFNRRIEPCFVTGSAPVQANYLSILVPAFLKDPSGSNFNTMMDGLTYKVQIMSIKRMLDNGPILSYPNAAIETSPNLGTYIYTLGLYSDFASAEAMRTSLLKEGVTEAFVVAYVKGVRINSEEAKKWASAYPDLNLYLNAKKSK